MQALYIALLFASTHKLYAIYPNEFNTHDESLKTIIVIHHYVRCYNKVYYVFAYIYIVCLLHSTYEKLSTRTNELYNINRKLNHNIYMLD